MFKELKEKFTKEPVLAVPDLNKRMRMKVDTSDYTMGEMLSMECEDSRWRPVAFLSKFLNKTERNYEIHDKEMLVIVRSLENWRHLLEDIHFKFDIVATTHWNSTCSMLTLAKLTEGYLVVGITRELDKEPLLHCYPINMVYMLSDIIV